MLAPRTSTPFPPRPTGAGQMSLSIQWRASTKACAVAVSPSTAIVKELLRAWAARGRSVLYTSHLLDVVERVCDRMSIVASGRVLSVGSMEALRAEAGRDGSLEQLFGVLTEADDPGERAAAILGE